MCVCTRACTWAEGVVKGGVVKEGVWCGEGVWLRVCVMKGVCGEGDVLKRGVVKGVCVEGGGIHSLNTTSHGH